MQKHYYALRYQVDRDEWRARAKRALIFQLWKKFHPQAGKKGRMLDFGCGSGLFISEFEKRYPAIDGYGIDIAQETISFCKKRGLRNVYKFSGRQIPFPAGTFDLVTVIDVLEHIKDDSMTLREINRVLKRGGLAIILVPGHKELYSTRDIRLQHVRRFEKGELEDKCQKAGLKVMLSKNVDFLLYFILFLMCRLAPKKNGVPHLTRETASTNRILNELIYGYEVMEVKLLQYIDFPKGISIAVAAKKYVIH